MSDFQQQALALAAQQKSPAWLAGLRAQAAMDWPNVIWPTRKTEHWKYTPLASLQKTILDTINNSALVAVASSEWKADVEFIAVDATRLVFVNGVFDAASSSELPDYIVRFSQANVAQQQVIAQHLGKVVEGQQHLFAVLNNAWLDDGVLVHVPRNQRLQKPVYVVQVATLGERTVSVNQRLLVVLEDSAQAEVIEHYISSNQQQNSFVN